MKARNLYHNLGCPTVENMKSLLRSNAIQDCPVTAEHVTNAEAIFGPDIGTLKGKTTHRKPRIVTQDVIAIPPEIRLRCQELTLEIDVMHINGMPMLTTIDTKIKYRGLIPLKNRTKEQLYEALDKVFRHYNKGGFRITRILADHEFEAILEEVSDELDTEINCPPAGEHVPGAERNNRTIEERIRAAFHNLPYQGLTRLMWRFLAMEQTKKLTIFPVKGGVSKY
jgi:hypothetical protein